MKQKTNQRFAAIILSLLLLLALSGCKPTLKNSGIEELTCVVETEGDLLRLDEYPDLKKLDLSGSTLDHVRLGEWIAIHPWIDITYTIPVGDQFVSCEATSLTVPKLQSSYEELLQNLKYLPALTEVHLEDTTLTVAQITDLRDTYRDLDITYTASLAGDVVSGDITAADLSQLTSADVEEVSCQLAKFPALAEVSLSDAQGRSNLAPADVAKLIQTAPEIRFLYSFDLFGKTVSSTDTALEYKDTEIGNSGVELLRQTLDIMPGCTRLTLDGCGIDSEVLAQLKLDYPNTTVGWRVDFAGKSLMTDTEALRIGKNVTDADTTVLQHFTEVKHLLVDNTKLTDFRFLAAMPQLESATMSKTQLTDLKVFSGCTELLWLEVAECRQLAELSGIENLSKLKYLNISGCFEIQDLSPLRNLPLENLMCLNSKVPPEERTAVTVDHPNALIRFGAGYNFGYGWYYADYSKTPTNYYEKLRKIFDLT